MDRNAIGTLIESPSRLFENKNIQKANPVIERNI